MNGLDGNEEDLRIDSEVRSEGANPLYGALSHRGSDPIKLACNPMSPGWPAQTDSQCL